MSDYIINGGKKLNGVVEVPCAKNSYLAILACCVLFSGNIILKNVPNFKDINKMIEILKDLGAIIDKKDKNLYLNCRNINNCVVSNNLAKEIRSSIFLMGSIIGRMGKAVVSYPGGCDIGSRPIDLHLKGLKDLGVKIEESHGIIFCEAQNLKGRDIHLDYPSVGATENIMMASVFTKGVTKIYNPAKEPEIIDLQNFINALGGRVFGAGENVIIIEGVEKLSKKDIEYLPISDRIISGTYLLGVATCGGDITLKNVEKEHIYSILDKLESSGCEIYYKDDSIRLISNRRLNSFRNIQTLPYPGFPTDLQPQTMVLECVSLGNCIITENLFETRFKHVPELIKMGADIKIQDRSAIINGREHLYGAEISCSDLRAGAALTIAGLKAEGQTILHNVYHIDRGYEKLEEVFSNLGADIKRV